MPVVSDCKYECRKLSAVGIVFQPDWVRLPAHWLCEGCGTTYLQLFVYNPKWTWLRWVPEKS